MKADFDSGPLKKVRCDWCGRKIPKRSPRVLDPVGIDALDHNTYHVHCYQKTRGV